MAQQMYVSFGPASGDNRRATGRTTTIDDDLIDDGGIVIPIDDERTDFVPAHAINHVSVSPEGSKGRAARAMSW